MFVTSAGAVLPNERAYEMVSPAEKSGAAAGAGGSVFANGPGYSVAGADGNNAIFYSAGVMGDVVPGDRGLQDFTAATRTATGWKAQPSNVGPDPSITIRLTAHQQQLVYPSTDASRLMFVAPTSYGLPNPIVDGSKALYLGTPGKPVEWLSQPTATDPEPTPGNLENVVIVPVGGSPDLSTSYFGYCGTLTPEDAPRQGHTSSGFYESNNGQLENAGVLPDGSVDPDGAAPAAAVTGTCGDYHGTDAFRVGNQVSKDGSKAFFVSPDPFRGTTRPTQLYVRENGASVLVSRDATGNPSAHGVMGFPGPNGFSTPFSFANSDGSHVVFSSEDNLTADAPNDSTQKYYDFDVAQRSVSYLPGVSGAILAVDGTGDRILFNKDTELDLWDGDHVVKVSDLQALGTFDTVISPRVSDDGRTFVFTSTVPLTGTTAHPSGTAQVYRYQVGDSQATCISCSVPASTITDGTAYLSHWDHRGDQVVPDNSLPLRDARNVSPDGRRIFFDTTNDLLPADTNGKRDVYQWEDGKLSLITTGQSGTNSYLLDSSESGDDVFFATRESLVSTDTDGDYDVYDARVDGGFAGVVQRAPCQGDDCQPVPRGPVALAIPTTDQIFGPGNVVPPPVPKATSVTGKVKVSSSRGTKGKIVLRVAAPGSGRITASGSGLKTATKTAKRKTSYSVTVKLTAASTRALRKSGKRAVRLKVAFRPTKGKSSSTTVRVTVRK